MLELSWRFEAIYAMANLDKCEGVWIEHVFGLRTLISFCWQVCEYGCANLECFGCCWSWLCWMVFVSANLDVESGVCLGGLWKCCKGCGCILGCEPWLGVRNMCWKQPLWVVWLYVCFVCWIGGCEAISFARNARAIAVFTTNRRNKGLISVDRRTSLLSYLQYPVSYQSRLQRIYCSQCPKGD